MDFVFPPPRSSPCPLPAARPAFPCIASTASAATMRPTPARWATTPTANRPSSFRRTPTASSTDGTFPYPGGATEVHHEIELAVALQSGGSTSPPQEALNCVFGYAVALDMTRRDLQTDLEASGPSLGSRQSLRALGPLLSALSRSGNRPPRQRRHHPSLQRHAAPDRGPGSADLACTRSDRPSLAIIRIATRGRYPNRHA